MTYILTFCVKKSSFICLKLNSYCFYQAAPILVLRILFGSCLKHCHLEFCKHQSYLLSLCSPSWSVPGFLVSPCKAAALLLLAFELTSNIAMSSLTCRDQSNTLFRMWALLSFVWHQKDTFVLFSIFFPISCWLFWLPLHAELMISVKCWWTQHLFPELQLLPLR